MSSLAEMDSALQQWGEMPLQHVLQAVQPVGTILRVPSPFADGLVMEAPTGEVPCPGCPGSVHHALKFQVVIRASGKEEEDRELQTVESTTI